MRNTLAAVLLALSAASSTFAQQPLPYERVLFPIVAYDDVRGANGSLWRTAISIVNVGNEPLDLFAPHSCVNCSNARALRPNLTYAVVPINGANGFPGSFLFVNRADVENLRASINVRDVSRQADNLGVQIPVVRESEFRSDRITLLNITRDMNYRYNLRLYSLQSGNVTIRAYEETGTIPNAEGGLPDDLLLGETTATLVRNTSSQFANSYPGFASVMNIAGLQGTHERPVRLDIIPAPGVTVWAFLTITNNVTQDFTVVAP